MRLAIVIGGLLGLLVVPIAAALSVTLTLPCNDRWHFSLDTNDCEWRVEC